MPREYRPKEVRDAFLDQIKVYIQEWSRKKGIPRKEALEGCTHQILALIDGEGPLPGFILAPHPHFSDKTYNQEILKDNWFPENNDTPVNCDISGDLHLSFYEKDRP
jgi:hypothetical protein